MPTFNVVVRENVVVDIEYQIEANTKEDAAIIGLRKWVYDGEGQKNEAVVDRWADVNGEPIEGVDEDSETSEEKEEA